MNAVGRCGRRGRQPVVHDTNAPAVRVAGLSASYDGHIALDGVSFELAPGEQLAVVGPNGAGKSTLLLTLAGLLPSTTGTVEIHGHPPQGHICIAFVPQESALDWRFPVTVSDVVAMGRVGRLGPLRRMRASDRELVQRALEDVGLLDLAHRTIDALSGGERQRMLVARALAQESDVVLMDEPFAGLDVHSRDELIAVLSNLRSHEVTLLVALHDLGIAAAHFDKVLLLKGRSLGFGEPKDVLTESALRGAYGSCLRMVEGPDGILVVHDTACSGGSRSGPGGGS
jgi:manganese/iron transport system ATP-binding protein